MSQGVGGDHRVCSTSILCDTVCSFNCAYCKIPLSPPLKKREALSPFRKGGFGGIDDWSFVLFIYFKWSQMELKLV